MACAKVCSNMIPYNWMELHPNQFSIEFELQWKNRWRNGPKTLFYLHLVIWYWTIIQCNCYHIIVLFNVLLCCIKSCFTVTPLYSSYPVVLDWLFLDLEISLVHCSYKVYDSNWSFLSISLSDFYKAKQHNAKSTKNCILGCIIFTYLLLE